MLLKGFGVHGAKWPLVCIYFLPSRNLKEIRHRWTQLVKEAGRHPPPGTPLQPPLRADGRLDPPLADFLSALRDGLPRRSSGSRPATASAPDLSLDEDMRRAIQQRVFSLVQGGAEEADFEEDYVPSDDDEIEGEVEVGMGMEEGLGTTGVPAGGCDQGGGVGSSVLVLGDSGYAQRWTPHAEHAAARTPPRAGGAAAEPQRASGRGLGGWGPPSLGESGQRGQ